MSLADFGGVHVSTVSRIIVRVSEALASLAGTFIQFPSTPDAIKKSQNDFYEIASFPRVIGVIGNCIILITPTNIKLLIHYLDGTHVRIQSPGGADAEVFRNRKSYFSINVQVVGNAHLEIIDIVARWPGSSHDSTIFNHSRLRRNFELGLYPNSILLGMLYNTIMRRIYHNYFLGDSGYNARTYLLTPLLNPEREAERLYNESHIRTRARIENIFGIWKRRFPILAYGCRLKLQTILTVIIATAVLHNIARRNGEGEPPVDENVDEHILQQRINDGEIPDIPVFQNQPQHTGFHVRRNLIDNFFNNLHF